MASDTPRGRRRRASVIVQERLDVLERKIVTHEGQLDALRRAKDELQHVRDLIKNGAVDEVVGGDD